MKTKILFFVIFMTHQFIASISFAEVNLGENVLNERLNKYIVELRELNVKDHAELLAPTYFKKFNRQVEKTKNLIKDGGRLKKINNSLREVTTYMQKIRKVVEQGRLTYADILAKRETLINRYNSEKFIKVRREADSEIRDGGEEIEDGDLKGAKKQADDIIEALFDAEVAGSLTYYMEQISQIEKTIDRSLSKKLMKKNFNKVNSCKSDLDDYIRRNPGEHEIIKQSLNDCIDKWHRLKARLTFAEKAYEDDWRNQDLILYFDNRLDDLLMAKGREAENTFTIRNKMNALKSHIEEDNSKLKKFAEKIEYLNTTLSAKESELDRLMSEKKTREKRVEAYEKLHGLYNKKIALVKIENSDIVIDLYGLTFKPGGYDTTSQAFTILEKVKKTIEIFKGKKITIVGHTDSLGNPKSNRVLSRQRAKTVIKYLLSTGVIANEDISSKGQGDIKPLRPNTTPENRKKNRRVEIRVKDVFPL